MWNNLNLAIGATVYIDVFNIQQPKQTDITTGTQKMITCSIDLDDSYANGISGAQEILDSAGSLQPINTAIAKISILSTSVDNFYIRTTQIFLPQGRVFTWNYPSCILNGSGDHKH